MFQISLGAIMIFFGVLFVFAGASEKLNLKNYVLKTEVVEALSGDWMAESFMCGGEKMIGSDGKETRFYSKTDMDERIKKLNKILAK